MLTRIYGISFPKKSMLDEYLVMMEEAKKLSLIHIYNADDGKNLKSTGGAADRQAAPLFTGYRPSAATPNRA